MNVPSLVARTSPWVVVTDARLGLMISVFCQGAWHANLRLDADGLPDDMPPYALHFVVLLTERTPAEFAAGAGKGMDVATETTADGRLLARLTGDWPGAD